MSSPLLGEIWESVNKVTTPWQSLEHQCIWQIDAYPDVKEHEFRE